MKDLQLNKKKNGLWTRFTQIINFSLIKVMKNYSNLGIGLYLQFLIFFFKQ
jgi:hypothetical protein